MANVASETVNASPSGSKKLGFFKRHLHRRQSSIPATNIVPPPTFVDYGRRSSSPGASLHRPGVSRKPSQVSQSSSLRGQLSPGMLSPDGVNGSGASTSSHSPGPQSGSRSAAIKWAAAYEETKTPSLRLRRTSSTGTRKTSIYQRGSAGSYVEGVDAGVGSKARRLSVQITDRFQVDECPLTDHFGFRSRTNKKDIGEGGAAVVRRMQSKTASGGPRVERVFAVKEFREWDRGEETEEDYALKIRSEYAIAKACRHPHIVETFRLCVDRGRWFHVMEYCDLGDLNDLIQRNYMSAEDRTCMFKQLLRGIVFLHSRGVAHRDIKSENLLVSRTGRLKIADFGTAEVFSGVHPGIHGCRPPSPLAPNAEIRHCPPGLVGSRPYMAPEIIRHEGPYDPRAVDVWAAAIVHLSQCAGGTPWEAAHPDVNNYGKFANTWEEWKAHLDPPPSPSCAPPRITAGHPLPAFAQTQRFASVGGLPERTCLMAMLHPDPAARWSAADVLAHPALNDAPCCQQDGYSDDIRTRQRKVRHDHVPPSIEREKGKKGVFR